MARHLNKIVLTTIRHFLMSFDVPLEEEKQPISQEVNDILMKIKSIHDSIIQIKSDIQAYHSEISSLSDHIVTKLFKSNPTLSKV